MWLRVIPTVALHEAGLPQSSTRAAAQGRNAIDEWQQLVTSCRFADVRRATTGIPLASVRT
jgi:hypothetical protein